MVSYAAAAVEMGDVWMHVAANEAGVHILVQVPLWATRSRGVNLCVIVHERQGVALRDISIVRGMQGESETRLYTRKHARSYGSPGTLPLLLSVIY